MYSFLYLELFCLKLITALCTHILFSKRTEVPKLNIYGTSGISDIVSLEQSISRLRIALECESIKSSNTHTEITQLLLRIQDRISETTSFSKWVGSYQAWMLCIVDSCIVKTNSRYKIRYLKYRIPLFKKKTRRWKKRKSRYKRRRRKMSFRMLNRLLRNRRGLMRRWYSSLRWNTGIFSYVFNCIGNLYIISIYTTKINTIYSLTKINGEVIIRISTGAANKGEFKKSMRGKPYSARIAAQEFFNKIKIWRKKNQILHKVYILLCYHGFHFKRKNIRKLWKKSGLCPIIIYDRTHKAYNGCKLKHKPRK